MALRIIFDNTKSNSSAIDEYLDFNNIAYSTRSFYDDNFNEFGGAYIIPEDLFNTSTVLIITVDVLFSFISFAPSRKNFIDFLEHGSTIVFQDMDSFVNLNSDEFKKEIIKIDEYINANSLHIFVDALPSDRHWINNLKNISIEYFNSQFFQMYSRITNATVAKSPLAKDFLVTTILRKTRPHRYKLYKKLESKEFFDNKGICVFHNNGPQARNNWNGQMRGENNWNDGHASMDLYLNANIEIVPETCYKDGYFFTEKTMKPIITKTPFLMVSNCGFLEYLKNLGFKTFDSLINEKYDKEYNIDNRIDLLLESLADIIKNGTREFYLAAEDILEHNQNRLFEISGKYQYNLDIQFHNVFEKLEGSGPS